MNQRTRAPGEPMTDRARTRAYLATIVVLAAIIAAMGYKFIVAGATEKADDGRLAVVLEPAERALVLREMREFVVMLQAITAGLAHDDMKAVAKASRAMGSARSHDVPAAMVGKLPLEFKALAFSLHRDLDIMAMDADSIGVPSHTLGQVADALQKCVACHNRYRVKDAQAPLGDG
jgi:hypothetical protein